MKIQSSEEVRIAYNRNKDFLHHTPLISSETLNQMLNAKVFFKVDSLQKTGAFKVRGVLNHLLALREKNQLPNKIVGYSTGNHGIGMAFAAKTLGITSRIYFPGDTSAIKRQAASFYGAEVICTNLRIEAEENAKADVNKGYYFMHPSDSDLTIAGAGTMCYEALMDMKIKPDAIFAPCGGGGLLAGSYLAKELLSPKTLLIGSEPENANDAYLSLKQNSIYRFADSPNTIADGLKALAVSKRSFSYLKRLDDFMTETEQDIYYWTAWLIHLLKITCEPSCAVSMASVFQWLKKNPGEKTVLVLISGGNIDPELYRALWKDNYLLNIPKL